MRARRQAILGPLLLAALTGCAESGPTYLEGSLADVYDVRFDEVRARLYDSELSIEYLLNDPDEGQLVSLRVALENISLAENTAYDLVDRGDIGRSDSLVALPDVEEGRLVFDTWTGEEGSAVVGDFDASFLTSDETTLVLRGGFDTTLELVEL